MKFFRVLIALALLVAVPASAGNITRGNSFSNVILTGNIIQQFAGQTRLLTPTGGALVREYADSAAAVTGPIEIGMSYNCAVNPVTGVWAGRDIADKCWLEKWNDSATAKQFLFAATAAAGVAPTWITGAYITIDGIYSGGGVTASKFATFATGRAVQNTAAQATATIAQGIASTYIATPAAAITTTLAAPSGDGERRRVCFGSATTVTWAYTAPATAGAIKTAFAAGECVELVYNSVAGTPTNSAATTWYTY